MRHRTSVKPQAAAVRHYTSLSSLAGVRVRHCVCVSDRRAVGVALAQWIQLPVASSPGAAEVF
jgi:hypothetical protein